MKSITFVSAFLDLDEDRSDKSLKSVDNYFEHFSRLASTGISICLFMSKKYMEKIKDICDINPNIYLVSSPYEIYDTWTYKTTKLFPDIKLPEIRSSIKDTYNYLISQNSKFEFMEKAIQINPFNASHFSWIDFGICHIINSQKTLDKLYSFSESSLKDKIFAIPGCWDKNLSDNFINEIFIRPYWRFCGGFFVGDKDSILDFVNCYRTYYTKFLQDKKILAWEVNIWTWMEYNNYLKPEFYEANHNDSMLLIPSYFLK